MRPEVALEARAAGAEGESASLPLKIERVGRGGRTRARRARLSDLPLESLRVPPDMNANVALLELEAQAAPCAEKLSEINESLRARERLLTRGMAARTSGASRSRRLAVAEAVSSRSRALRDSLISLSFSAQGAAWASSSRRATFAFMSGGTRRLSKGRSESLARRARVLPPRPTLSILRGSEADSPSAPAARASRATTG